MTLNRICISLPLLLSVSLLAGCDQSSVAGEETVPRPVKVVMAAAEQDKIVSLPGVVRARIETDLAFRTLVELYPQPCACFLRDGFFFLPLSLRPFLYHTLR